MTQSLDSSLSSFMGDAIAFNKNCSIDLTFTCYLILKYIVA